jgi:uncharacterized membrane protein
MGVLAVMTGLAIVLASPLLGLFAFMRMRALAREMGDLRVELAALRARVERLTRPPTAAPPFPAPAATVTAPAAVVAPEPARAAVPPPVPLEAAPSSVSLPTSPSPRPPAPPILADTALLPAPRRPPSPPSPPGTARGDFASNLGPKILAAGAGLAFVVTLALFVKIAWDNNWVGPTGRVLSGAVFGLGLLAGGVRLMRREYRPLGQALAGAGLAGLYTSAFAAHAFYHLIPRGMSGTLMVVITGCAVLLAARLDARILAALAWVGGYMTPLLLSTGEDKAIALFLFLAVLDAGAVILDHRKPWPETVPLALLGTIVLYTGWYAQFFTPARFGTAAFGMVLFTALFALGMAPKDRDAALATVFVVAGLGLTVLAGSADRPEVSLVLALALGAAAVREAARRQWAFVLVAAFAMVMPFLTWAAAFYRPDAFGIAAAWVVGALLMLLVPWVGGAVTLPVGLEGAVLIGAALVSVVLCHATDRPAALLLYLLAQAGVAMLVRRRWEWAEVIGAGGAALSVLAWMDAFFGPARAGDAYLIALPVAGAYLIALIVRGLVRRERLRLADGVAHLVTALFTWTVLYRVLYATSPKTLGLASVGLAVLYLLAGLAALREHHRDAGQARVLLGLAAALLTVAIPVQLGLQGITLAWSVEAVLLLWLGLRFESTLARIGGYLVLGLAIVRLFVRHLPLHAGSFDPVFNPGFGIWIFVIGAIGVALLLTREAAKDPSTPDHAVRPVLATLALVLLFGVLTAETSGTFDQQARLATAAGDLAGAQSARRVGGLAVSVLWTVFATGLLGAGLGLRNHPLFYAAYGLFGLTAAKVVFWDLQTFSVPYRMLSFLALALLLTAGAYLNLRFRERLTRREAA